MRDLYADVSRRAASISLRLCRVREGRGTANDRTVLEKVGEELSRIANGDLDTKSADPLFSKVEGLYVVYLVAKEEQGDSVGSHGEKEYLVGVSKNVSDALSAERGRPSAALDLLRDFFAAVHDLAEELTVTGPKTDPVRLLSRVLA